MKICNFIIGAIKRGVNKFTKCKNRKGRLVRHCYCSQMIDSVVSSWVLGTVLISERISEYFKRVYVRLFRC